MVNGLKKGKAAEREVKNWLQPIVTQVYNARGRFGPFLQRNCNQNDAGGNDLIGLDWLALEIKHYAKVSPGKLADWWAEAEHQALTYAKEGQTATPVLIYKVNGKWRARMKGWAGGHPDCDNGEVKFGTIALVDVSAEDFQEWFTFRLRDELTNQIAKNAK